VLHGAPNNTPSPRFASFASLMNDPYLRMDLRDRMPGATDRIAEAEVAPIVDSVTNELHTRGSRSGAVGLHLYSKQTKGGCFNEKNAFVAYGRYTLLRHPHGPLAAAPTRTMPALLLPHCISHKRR
jgi:hypothetical protein